jgi:flagellar basal-body rod protein FlgB
MLDNIGLMQGIGGKMNWLQQRQTVLTGNIANADTPDYMARDITKPDFATVMGKSSNTPRIQQIATDGAHIGADRRIGDAKEREVKDVYEAAPVGNAVILEEQLIKAQKTSGDYSMMTNLYRKNVGMIKFIVSK